MSKYTKFLPTYFFYEKLKSNRVSMCDLYSGKYGMLKSKNLKIVMPLYQDQLIHMRDCLSTKLANAISQASRKRDDAKKKM